MSIESADDRAVFLNPDEFGCKAVMPDEDPIVGFSGMLQEEPALADDGYGVGVSSMAPTFTVRTLDLPDIRLDGAKVDIVHPITGVTLNFRFSSNPLQSAGFTIFDLKEVDDA